MTIKRRIEEVDTDGRRRITVEEPAVVDKRYDEAIGHDAAVESRDEIVRSTGGPSDVVRGAVRTFGAVIAVVALAFEALLAFRFAFLLFVANASNGFVNFIYDASGWLADPFDGIASRSTSGDGVFDPATLIAMVVVFTVAVLIIMAFWAATSFPSLTSERASSTHTRYEGHSARERDDTYVS